MRRSIGVEVLVPNAFIKLNEERQNNIYSLPLSMIEEYGYAVIKTLNNKLEHGDEVYLILNLGQEKMFREKYNKYFSFIDLNEKEKIVNLMVDLETLKQCFNQYSIYYELSLQEALNENVIYLKYLYAKYADDSYTRKRQM